MIIETELFSATDSNVFIENTGYVNLIARICYHTLTDKNNSIVNLSTEWKRFDKDGNLLENNPNNSNIFYGIIRNNELIEKISATSIIKKCYETEIKFPCAKVAQLNTIQCLFNSTIIDITNNFKINLLGSETIVVTTTPQLSCR